MVIYPPNHIPKQGKAIFLAGSIEMGKANNWQEHLIKNIDHSNLLILNPRRKDWDNSWKEEKENPKFNEQVSWELSALERSDLIVMYFDPNTKSPISMLELGLFAQSGKMIVCCPKGFWKKGNVDVVCERYGIKQFASLDELINELKAF
ncbi:MAG: hypothetical protein DRJ10_09840 [Bacteroidetes bacterium]|nr:MAG: hypothetical protein DRJ10_09840 [Bacteroidota bacterium]